MRTGDGELMQDEMLLKPVMDKQVEEGPVAW